ncbi:reverse transcriptase domain-containing protein [Tanacetum coccineum]
MIRMRDDILEEDMSLRRRFVLTAPPPGCDVAESSVAAAARPPKGQYDFVDIVEARQGLIRSPGHDSRTIARAANRAEDVVIIIISICIDIVIISHIHYILVISKIIPVTRQGANDAMTPESIQAMIDQAIQRNSTHTQDDASQSSGRGLRRHVQPARMESVFYISGCTIDNQVKFATCTLLGDALTWWNGHVRTLGHDAAYAITWGTLKKKLTNKYYPKGEIKKLEIKLWNLKTEKVDKYISRLPDNIHGNVMSERPKTLDDAIELANDLIDHKLRTYAERQNDNKRKADDSSRNNQQPHKKQNVARAYTASPGEKKAYTGNLPLCTKCNYHHIRQCAPKCGNCKRYGCRIV